MQLQRIASFLPGATEVIYALGAQDRLVGVTPQCTRPAEAMTKPRIVDAAVDARGLGSRRIDEAVRGALRGGLDAFVLNEGRIMEARPDLIVAQDTCRVCAPHAGQVLRAMDMLEPRPRLHLMDPHGVGEILSGIEELAEAIGLEDGRGAGLRAGMEERIGAVGGAGFGRRPRVVAVEWLDPLFTAGHWVPEMVEIAGGQNMIGEAGGRSRVMAVDEVAGADPDIIVLMPCGLGAGRIRAEYERSLKGDRAWAGIGAVRGGNVFAVDAGSFFSRPGIGIAAGIEILAKILHPELFAGMRTPRGAFARLP